MLEDLPPSEVHVWWTDPAGPLPPARRERYLSLLAPAERARHDRFRFDQHRQEYLLTRALVRATLSRYLAVPPAAWSFEPGPHGRPEISGPAPAGWLHFNLSNTTGLVACAVARELEVGIDVEDTARHGETVGVANRFFAPSEVEELRALAPERQRDRFFDYWTLKEAYIKARGMGLALPLGKFAFRFTAAGVAIAFDPSLGDDAAAWQFQQLQPTARHKAALAIQRGARGAPVRIHERWTVPLED